MDFSNGLLMLAGVFVIIIMVSYFNEKVVKLPTEIGLMAISLVVALVILFMKGIGVLSGESITGVVGGFNLHDIILNGFLCFLLFSGSATITIKDLGEDKLLIGSLAFVSTLIATLVYAVIAVVIARAVNINMTFIEGCVLGSIIAPTDPISAMSILKKAGLPERLSMIMEGESLFNDGLAVALFITFTSIMKKSSGNLLGTFVGTVGWNVIGAILVGVIISRVLFYFFKRTSQKHLEIIISLAAVTLAYSISEKLEVSGPTAAVVVGIVFATNMSKLHKDNESYYVNFYSFWRVVDKMLNAFLYILIGLAIFYVHRIDGAVFVSITAIATALLARFISVLGPIELFSRSRHIEPKHYTKEIHKKDRWAMAKLLTWAGLKGGICIALALGTKEIFSPEQYNFVVISTYAVVAFSTIVQGLTVKKVYKRVKGNICQRKDVAL